MEPKKHPMNLQGLLRLAVEQQTTHENGTEKTDTLGEIDAEKREFLEGALKDMTINVVEEFEKAIAILENAASEPSQKVGALNIVRDHIDNIDFASSFVKAGGSDVLLRCAEVGQEDEVRAIALNTIAEICQNNPFSQKHFVDADIIPLLLPYTKEKEDIAKSALHVLSSLIRNFEPGLLVFLSSGGLNILLSHITTCHSRVFIKLCFIIANVSSENAFVRDEFVKKLAMVKLFDQLEVISGFDIKTETLLFALSELSKSDNWNSTIENKDDVEYVLNQIITINAHLPQCEEMVTYANIILKKLN